MLTYILRRLGVGLILALLVTLIVFMLLTLSHETVLRSQLGSGVTPEAMTALGAQLGFDRPALIQYLDWLGGVIRLDFGRSYSTSELVGPAVTARLAVTLSVVLVALIVVAVVSVLLGVTAAVRGGIVDRAVQVLSLIGMILPALLVGIVLVVVFAVQLRLVPATGFTPITTDPLRWGASILLPVIVLSLGGVAGISAQVRGSMLDEMRKDYVRTLVTRGLPRHSIVLRHALRNASGPGLTVLSLEFISMFGGALFIEKIFALPGYGMFAFTSSLQSDIPVIMGVTLFAVLLVVGVHLIVDLLNGWLNPKARSF